jgi:nicotinate-nucleotide adenylyltransferase
MLEFVSKRVSELYRIVPENREIRHPVLSSVYSLQNTRMDISSTRIRELAAEGRSVRYLVPNNVWSYIGENGLYPGAASRPHSEGARNNDA